MLVMRDGSEDRAVGAKVEEERDFRLRRVVA